MHKANVPPSYWRISLTDNEIVLRENKKKSRLVQSNSRKPNDKSAL